MSEEVKVTKTTEERLVTLESQQEVLTTILHQFITKIQDLSGKSNETMTNVAAMIRTVMDNKPLTKESLIESNLQNKTDQINNQLQMAIKNGLLTAAEVVSTDSVVLAQQFDETGKEVVRRILIEVNDLPDDFKSSFVGKKAKEEVVAKSTVDNVVNTLIVHEIYNKVEKVEKVIS